MLNIILTSVTILGNDFAENERKEKNQKENEQLHKFWLLTFHSAKVGN